MTRADLHRLIDELPDEVVDRVTTLIKQAAVSPRDPEQAWFWTPEWLSGEIEADAESEAGGVVYEDEADFVRALRASRRI